MVPNLGSMFILEMENKFHFLEKVMQMVVDCVFHGKNLFEEKKSMVDFERQGSLLKIEDRKDYLSNFLRSFRSK